MKSRQEISERIRTLRKQVDVLEKEILELSVEEEIEELNPNKLNAPEILKMINTGCSEKGLQCENCEFAETVAITLFSTNNEPYQTKTNCSSYMKLYPLFHKLERAGIPQKKYLKKILKEKLDEN